MILEKELARIRYNEQAVSTFKAAIEVLEDHRIIYFLRAFGRPIRDKDSTAEFLAAEASYAAGWQDCLDSLVNFVEFFIQPLSKNKAIPAANYGARKALIEGGMFTEKELDDGYPNRSGNAASGEPAKSKFPKV